MSGRKMSEKGTPIFMQKKIGKCLNRKMSGRKMSENGLQFLSEKNRKISGQKMSESEIV